MPLISMYERDNSRTVYGLLSDKAVQQFDAPPSDEIDRLLFKSLARLLEHYRYDAFSDRDPIGVLDAAQPGSKTRRAHASGLGSNFVAVRNALAAAQITVFGHQDRDEVVEFLQGTLADLISGSNAAVPENAANRTKTKQFFAAFSDVLRGDR